MQSLFEYLEQPQQLGDWIVKKTALKSAVLEGSCSEKNWIKYATIIAFSGKDCRWISRALVVVC